MAQDTPSRSLDKVIVRLPDGMRDDLMAAAKASGRTMNAEIVQRLEASFGGMQAYMRAEFNAERLERLLDILENSEMLERYPAIAERRRGRKRAAPGEMGDVQDEQQQAQSAATTGLINSAAPPDPPPAGRPGLINSAQPPDRRRKPGLINSGPPPRDAGEAEE